MRRCLWIAITAVLPFALFLSCYAQLGPVRAVQPSKNGVTAQVGSLWMQLTAISPTTFRVQVSRTEKFRTVTSFAVIPESEKETPVQFHDSPKQIVISTGQLSAAIDRATGAVTFLDASGEIISQDKAGFPVEFHGDAFQVYKSMPIDEHFFGLGEKAGPLDHSGGAYTMWNTDAGGWVGGTDPLYKSIPFFLALRKGKSYGIYLDNSYRTSFNFGKQASDMYSFGSSGGPLDYYFFYGPDPKSVVSQYTELTGHTPLPPRWSLGYQQSRYSYYPESRVYEVAKELRERHIPTDVLYLDIDYLQDHAAFDINRTYFPHFEQMVQDLAKQNIKLVLISDLHLKAAKGYKPYDEGLAGDHFVKNRDGSVYVGPVWPGPSVFPEFTLARTRDWYGTLYKDFVQMGVKGFWNDMNEPAVFRYPEKTVPLDTVHRVDEPSGERKTDHREIHNVFGMEQVRATYDGVLKLAPNVRPFILTRAGFAGTQRYSATWTGDNQATWEHYRLSIPTLLNLGISGYAFVGDDVGGFAQSPPADLVTRWFEVGAFIPMFRDHNSNDTMPKEPWVHGPVHEEIRRHYIEERYRLMPYLYSAFEENSRDGIPVMRPLFLEYPTLGDPKQAQGDFVGNDSEFLFGHDLLVAPQLAETLNPIDVLLPPGDWFDYWSGRKVVGPHQFKIHPALEQLPVYVRAGAIIPEQPLVQSTAEVPQGPLELRVYPGPDCKGSLYWDDGETFDFKKGQYYRQAFTCERNDHGLTVNLGAVEGSYQPWWKTIKVSVYDNRAPKTVTINSGTAVTSEYQPNAPAASFEVPAARSATRIDILY
jgi:alpha-glucosidase